MSLISELGALLVGISGAGAKRTLGVTDDDVDKIRSRMDKVKIESITSLAKQSIQTYPVIMSEPIAIADENLSFAISKSLEMQYAVFTMIAASMDPILKEGITVRQHLGSYRGVEDGEVIDKTDGKVLLDSTDPEISLDDTIATPTEVCIGDCKKAGITTESLINSSKVYRKLGLEASADKTTPIPDVDESSLGLGYWSKDDREEFIMLRDTVKAENERLYKAMQQDLAEANADRQAKFNKTKDELDRARREEDVKYRKEQDRVNNEYRDNKDRRQEELKAIEFNYRKKMDKLRRVDELAKVAREKAKGDKEDRIMREGAGITSAKITKIETKDRSSVLPTVIEVGFRTENNVEAKVSIGIKSVMHFITGEESEQIFTYLREERPIVIAIKLLSGEIEVMKDLVFQMDRAKKDRRLYAKLGRHPWLRALLNRKDSRSVANVTDDGGKHILPVCSLIVTKEEFENGMQERWSKLRGKSDSIIGKLMLLCVGIVDLTLGTVEFKYHGFEGTTLIKIDELIKTYGPNGSSDGQDRDMRKLVASLVNKI